MSRLRTLSRFSVVLILGGLLIVASTAFAAGKKTETAAVKGPKTVVDHFLLVPESFLGIPIAERKALLEASGTVNDIKNGFISFTQEGGDSYAFTVFRKPTGGYLSALCFKGQMLSKTGAVKETCQLTFLDLDQGTWNDVTAKVLPTAIQKGLEGASFELPRIGTTIKGKRAESGEEFELLWKDGAFTKK